MVKAAKSNFTKEEELLLQDFGRGLSPKSSAIFYTHALVVSILPLWLFIQIHQMELVDNAIVFGVGSLISTYFISLAYKNNKFDYKHKIFQKRSEGVTAEVYNMMSESDSKNISKKERDERILWRKNDVAETESMQLAVFYTNSLFLGLLIFLSFFVFRSYNPMPNYIVSMFFASGAAALLSTSSNN